MRRLRGGAAAAAVAISLSCSAAANADTGYLTDPAFLYTLDTATVTASSPIGDLSRNYTSSAAHSDGKLYAISGDLGNQALYTIDRLTGDEKRIGPLLVPGDPYAAFLALASAPGGTLYASAYRGPTVRTQLYTVNTATGLATPVGTSHPAAAVVTMAGSCAGTLYGVDLNKNLVTINRTTGAILTIGPLQPALAADDDPLALAFERDPARLWMLSSNGGNPDHLFQVDPATGTLTPTTFNAEDGFSTMAFDSPASCDGDGDGVADPGDDCPAVAGPASNAGCPPDTDDPETTITKKPKDKSAKRKAKYKFKSDEPDSTFECKLDKESFKTCSSPKKLKVKPGKHKFQVRAIDPAGNVDPTPAKDRFKTLG